MRVEVLYDWCLRNGEYGNKLLEEFGDGNNSQEYLDVESGVIKTPLDFARGTHKKVKWTCSKCGQSYYVSPNLRTTPSSRTGCSFCAGNRLIKGKNDLLTWCISNGERGKTLLDEFGDGGNSQRFYDEEKKVEKKPSDYSRGSHTRIKWTCKNGHVWMASVKSRVTNKTNCSYCNPLNMTVPGKNDLYTWCMDNGEYGQMLLAELDKTKDAHSIAKKSSGKVKWICKRGHTWEAAPADRTSRFSYCPRCSGHSTSFPEQFLFHAIKQVFPSTRNRYQAFATETNPRGEEFDVAILQPVLVYDGVYIEYSPTGWHRGKEEKDSKKKKLCEDNNVCFICVVEDSYSEFDEEWNAPCIVAHLIHGQVESFITKVLESVLKYLGHSIDEVNLEKAKTDARKSTIGIIDIDKSLLYNYPDLCLEWDDSNPISPYEVTCGSNQKVCWKCTHCGNRWESSIYNRTLGYGCPKCHYNWKEKKVIRSATFVSMSHKYPELNAQLDRKKSMDINLNDIASANDKEKAWWICQECGSSYYQLVRSRALGYCGCPKCKREKKNKLV